MKRSLVACLAAVAAFACGDKSPTDVPLSQRPDAAISDAAHSGGNPDFFFLPPMVPNPSGDPAFDAGDFNAALQPKVQICEGTGSQASDPTMCLGTQVALFTTTTGPGSETVRVSTLDEHYIVNWHTDLFGLDPALTYRIRVIVGKFVLGFADVELGATQKELKNVNRNEYVPLLNGRTLPIKFRIENAALCFALNPLHNKANPCASAALGAGSPALLLRTPTTDETIAAVRVEGAASVVSTITMRKCPLGYLNPDFIDLPTFGDCVDIEADPPLSGSGLTGIASMCQATAGVPGMTATQAERITVHNLRTGGVVFALPDALGDCPEPTPPPGGARIGLGPFDRLIRVAHAGWRAVRDNVRDWLSAQPLWASLMVCHRGCGGEEFDSPVQAALPAKMNYANPADADRTVELGASVPIRVLVTDAGVVEGAAGLTPEPVEGARVHFEILDDGPGVLSALFAESDENGIAEVFLEAGLGTATVRASARGIADPDDPECPGETPETPCTVHGVFAPDHFTGSDAVALGEGTLDFGVEGLFADGFETESGWTATGFWNRSTLTTSSPPINNNAYPTYVNLAAGDASNGDLPAPFAGSWVFWYGEVDDGNYLGTQSPIDFPKSGGISTAPNSGALTSPPFYVPVGGTAMLRFNAWFEIESVDPDRFDIMRVSVRDVSTSTTTSLGVLNPATDPNGGAATPFTSGGFNTAPVWSEFSHNISAFAGQQVQLIFSFNTVDALYNGFRGWIVDNVRITREAAAPAPSSAPRSGSASSGGGLNPEPPAGVRQP